MPTGIGRVRAGSAGLLDRYPDWAGFWNQLHGWRLWHQAEMQGSV